MPSGSAGRGGCRSVSSRSAPARRQAASRRCAISPTSQEFAAVVYASAGVHQDAGDLDADRRARAGRFRAARLPDRQAPVARGHQGLSGRPQTVDRRPTASASNASARGTVCVMVAHGTPCLGPVTHAGCGAICPSYDRGCYGCFGPVRDAEHRRDRAANVSSLGMARARHRPRSSGPSTPAPRRFARRAERMAIRTIQRRLHRPRRGRKRARPRDPRRPGREGRASRIFEPPRFFEALLRGRGFAEVLDIVARICGICPIAYQMSGVHAIENALGVAVDPPIRANCAGSSIAASGSRATRCTSSCCMRRTSSAIPMRYRMARDHGEAVERGLSAKKGRQRAHCDCSAAGRSIRSMFGSAASTGCRAAANWRRSPNGLKRAREQAIATLRWAAGFDFPECQRDYEFVALRHAVEYPMNEGQIVSTAELDIRGWRVRERISRTSGRPFDGAAFGAEAARRLSRRTDGALRDQPRPPAGRYPRAAPTRSGSNTRAATLTAASWCAPSKSFMPAARHCG